MMISDKIRGVETTQSEIRRHQHAHDAQITQLVNSNVTLSNDVSQIGLQTAAIVAQIESIMAWGKRILMGLGLVLLSGQHLTIDQIAKLIRIAFGL